MFVNVLSGGEGCGAHPEHQEGQVPVECFQLTVYKGQEGFTHLGILIADCMWCCQPYKASFTEHMLPVTATANSQLVQLGLAQESFSQCLILLRNDGPDVALVFGA